MKASIFCLIEMVLMWGAILFGLWWIILNGHLGMMWSLDFILLIGQRWIEFLGPLPSGIEISWGTSAPMAWSPELHFLFGTKLVEQKKSDELMFSVHFPPLLNICLSLVYTSMVRILNSKLELCRTALCCIMGDQIYPYRLQH